ncbi:LTA synthase family protein [Campylobacter upsaliensis]|uniref:LTA synthase family protein n=1 Tax=Campylobacter upsaliensis TaxID=28080 RepID=UPI002B3D59D1|nr:LTA synthase family protein [Campylobacter upsaliensis]MEB2817227.1 LTA synthase family protein [Campylobacter upsaliensis]
MGGGGGVILKIYTYLSSSYIAFLSFVILISSFIHYYYFQMYGEKINVFIFGLKDDDTSAVLSIIFEDYPIVTILILAVLFSIFSFWFSIKIMRFELKKVKIPLVLLILLNVALLYLYTVALRGHFTYNALRASNYEFSTTKAFNEISTNPLMAFSWAYKEYKNTLELPKVPDDAIKNLEKELFDILDTTTSHNNHAKNHVYFNLMESFGLNVLEFSNEKHNFLAELQKHFDEDFVWKRFLSTGNNTIESLNRLIFLSPNIISNGLYQKQVLSLSPLQIYKKAGYEVIFVYSGNASWYNLGIYFKFQGADRIVDENTLLEEFPQAKATKHKYGIADEFMYEKIYSIFKEAKKPTLIVSLSISTHRPYIHESKKKLFDENKLEPRLLESFIIDNPQNALKTYAYANDEFGKFLSKVKQSDLKDKIIIAATGDHRFRDLKMDSNTHKAFAYSVPFYLYLPQHLRHNLYYDKNRVGSHKDIFPTLYHLSLSQTQYLGLGGRNMLAKAKDAKKEFGFNELVWIDENGVYSGDKGYCFENNVSLKNTNESFEPSLYHKNFSQNYKKLYSYQLSKRLEK